MQKPYHIPPSLELLNLQSNHLKGDIQLLISLDNGNITSSLYTILLANNSLSGSIPTSLCNIINLNVLDLSGNRLSGSIPSCACLVENTASLSVLDLGRNNITALIPDSFPVDCYLQYLDLNSNILQGKIPKSLRHGYLLELMNVENNIIEDIFPCMLSSSLRVLVLHSNRFHGKWKSGLNQLLELEGDGGRQIELRGTQLVGDTVRGEVTIIMKGLDVQRVKIWPEFTSIDLSCNHFGGEIPNAIGDLSSLHLLNLSHNAFNGSIPKSFGKLREIESLDLSQNNLTGATPEELAALTFLSVLNLSYNKLIGKIPNGRQLPTFSADSFKGNVGLCGFNLNITCTSHTHTDDLSHEKGEEEKTEIEWEYDVFGYVVGLGSFVWLLLFCRSFRQKYFGKIDEVVEDIFHARDMRRRSASARTRLMRTQAVRRRQ